MLNISDNTYRNYETGKVEPKMDRKKEIATAFGITLEDLESFGEGGVIFMEEVKCETGGFVNAKGIVHNNKTVSELEAEIERLKILNASKDQRIKDLEEINTLLRSSEKGK
jgi:DNA-binding XRE family transcriptional regulator